MINVGFIINFDPKKWLGGYNLIINLINSLLIIRNNKIRPILIVHNKFDTKDVKKLKIKILKTNLFENQGFYKKVINKLLIIIFGKSYIYEDYLKKNKIHAISHSPVFLGTRSTIKSFAWIPDFQFYHYPNNFSFKNRIIKRINIFLTGCCSTKIILSSKSAKNDLRKISAKAYKKSVINPFVFQRIEKKKIISLNNLKKKYGLSKKFIYLPNQYFVHKNHFVVLKSLKHILEKNKNTKIIIVSTGLNSDHRNKNHFKDIESFIQKHSLKKNYIYLGIVPYDDMMSLIYHSIAIINPSKFEGWSSSVEQAKSMGKKILLSDIDVHKEQNPNRGIFFKEDNFIQLSKIIENIWNSFDKKTEKKKFKSSYKLNQKNFENYALDFQKIIIKK